MFEKVQDRSGKKDLKQKSSRLVSRQKQKFATEFLFFSFELSRVRFIKGIVQLRLYPQDKVHVYH